jgi:hypothetical protein
MMVPMLTRETLHGMINELPPDQLHVAAMALTAILKPDSWDFLEFAPEEDEELSPTEIAALKAMDERRAMREATSENPRVA